MASIRIRRGVYLALAALAVTAGVSASPSRAATAPPATGYLTTVASYSPVGVSDLDGDGSGDVLVNETLRPTRFSSDAYRRQAVVVAPARG